MVVRILLAFPNFVERWGYWLSCVLPGLALLSFQCSILVGGLFFISEWLPLKVWALRCLVFAVVSLVAWPITAAAAAAAIWVKMLIILADSSLGLRRLRRLGLLDVNAGGEEGGDVDDVG